MARGKKIEKPLTPKAKLSQALVPVEEQPYSLPGNWCWTTLDFIADLFNGDRGMNYPSKKDYQLSGIPFINAGAIIDGELKESEFNFISEEKYATLRAGKIQRGDILYCLRGSLGKTAIVKWDGKGAISSSLCILRTNNAILKKYLYYLFCSDIITKQQVAAENGSAQPNLSAASVVAYFIPLSPIKEQQRIVDCIERLFAKLDETKEKAQAVVDSFETRKASILHKAFTGELTKQWRKEQKIKSDSWQLVLLKDISELQTGVMKGKKYFEKTVSLPYLRVANVQDGFLDLEEIKTIEIAESQIKRYSLQKGDVLFTEGGDFDKLGRGTVWQGEIEKCLHQNHIFAVRPDCKKLNPFFLSLQAGSNYGKKYFLSCSKQTTNLASINSTQLKNFPVKLPILEEQLEIIQVVNSLLSKEQQAKTTAETVLDQIDTMKKAILARAFRGELGTNDPEEESAVELLKSVL